MDQGTAPSMVSLPSLAPRLQERRRRLRSRARI